MSLKKKERRRESNSLSADSRDALLASSRTDLRNVLVLVTFPFPFPSFVLCAFSTIERADASSSLPLKGVLSRGASRDGAGGGRDDVGYDVCAYTRLFAGAISNCVVIREGARMRYPIARGNSEARLRRA